MFVGGGGSRVSGEGVIPKIIIYHPSYDETRWRTLRYRGGPIRDVIKRATSIIPALFTSPCSVSNVACHYYHIKGLCNVRYGRYGDHQPYPPGVDCALMARVNNFFLG